IRRPPSFLMIRRPPRSTRVRSSAASDVYKRQYGRASSRSCRSACCSCIPAGCCLLYTSPSPRDMRRSRMPSSA
ncbi:hypothetical protein, partial [Staphylococcus aureus]